MKITEHSPTQEKIQSIFQELPHVFVLGFYYTLALTIHTLVLAVTAITHDHQSVFAPFLFYFTGLAVAERKINHSFKNRMITCYTAPISQDNIKITWPMNDETYQSLSWGIVDISLDYLIIQWALTSSLPHNLVFLLLFGSKIVGVALQSCFCLVTRVNSQLFTSLLLCCLAAYWIFFMIELRPVLQIVIASLLVKGLLGNFLLLARIKLAQNSKVKITFV